MTRLFAYAQCIHGNRAATPGSAIGITLRVRSSDGELQPHTEPTISITDPAGGLIFEDVPMSTDGIDSTYYFESESTSLEGNYRVDAKCKVTPTTEVTLLATTRFKLADKGGW